VVEKAGVKRHLELASIGVRPGDWRARGRWRAGVGMVWLSSVSGKVLVLDSLNVPGRSRPRGSVGELAVSTAVCTRWIGGRLFMLVRGRGGGVVWEGERGAEG
jgi:hypothetical protein